MNLSPPFTRVRRAIHFSVFREHGVNSIKREYITCALTIAWRVGECGLGKSEGKRDAR